MPETKPEPMPETKPDPAEEWVEITHDDVPGTASVTRSAFDLEWSKHKPKPWTLANEPSAPKGK